MRTCKFKIGEVIISKVSLKIINPKSGCHLKALEAGEAYEVKWIKSINDESFEVELIETSGHWFDEGLFDKFISQCKFKIGQLVRSKISASMINASKEIKETTANHLLSPTAIYEIKDIRRSIKPNRQFEIELTAMPGLWIAETLFDELKEEQKMSDAIQEVAIPKKMMEAMGDGQLIKLNRDEIYDIDRLEEGFAWINGAKFDAKSVDIFNSLDAAKLHLNVKNGKVTQLGATATNDDDFQKQIIHGLEICQQWMVMSEAKNHELTARVARLEMALQNDEPRVTRHDIGLINETVNRLQQRIEIAEKRIEQLKKSNASFVTGQAVESIVDASFRNLKSIKGDVYLIESIEPNVDCNSGWKVGIVGQIGRCDSGKFKANCPKMKSAQYRVESSKGNANEDDDEPITDDWLQSIGILKADDATKKGSYDSCPRQDWHLCKNGSRYFLYEHVRIEVATRKELRSLLGFLRIKLPRIEVESESTSSRQNSKAACDKKQKSRTASDDMAQFIESIVEPSGELRAEVKTIRVPKAPAKGEIPAPIFVGDFPMDAGSNKSFSAIPSFVGPAESEYPQAIKQMVGDAQEKMTCDMPSPGVRAYAIYKAHMKQCNLFCIDWEKMDKNGKTAWELVAVSRMSSKDVGLRDEEMKVLDLTTDAWNSFIALEGSATAAIDDVMHAVHTIQNEIAFRLAKRINPANWV